MELLACSLSLDLPGGASVDELAYDRTGQLFDELARWFSLSESLAALLGTRHPPHQLAIGALLILALIIVYVVFRAPRRLGGLQKDRWVRVDSGRSINQAFARWILVAVAPPAYLAVHNLHSFSTARFDSCGYVSPDSSHAGWGGPAVVFAVAVVVGGVATWRRRRARIEELRVDAGIA